MATGNTELLNSSKLIDFVNEAKKDKLLLDEVKLKYSLKNNDVIMTGGGRSVFDEFLDEVYYENVEMSLDNTVLSWYGPLIHHLNCDTTATINIDTDGNYEESHIPITCNLILSNKEDEDKMPYLYNQFMKLVQLHKFIKHVTFVGHGHKLTNINITFEIDRKEFSTALSKLETPNMTLFNQWFAILKHVKANPNNRFKYTYEVPIQNGKMLYSIRRESITAKIVCNTIEE